MSGALLGGLLKELRKAFAEASAFRLADLESGGVW